nr:immunoglobulin light chain junction region [Macaca mulatta]MOX11383.1 immunoglobulin light chain junction region [Macaca mulatta]MOX11553.1 immunoglobulin light chain junction region [Macaca mulatta]MOX12013.1 immunoglobulin light chain junction region [Macaca mulatta]MOX12131.1 immunoglobulin light chain junction region [Macaca mulatta]
DYYCQSFDGGNYLVF